MSLRERYSSRPDTALVRGVCPHDCPDACAWEVAVDRPSGRALDLWGDPRHPITQGRLCGKVDRYLDRTYHPERLLRPRVRSGPKGSGQFREVSWDEALATATAGLRAAIDDHGAESILPYSYAGTLGYLQGEGMASRFFHALGASRLARTICAEAGFRGISYTIGATVGLDTPDYAAADLVWLWGTNTLTSNMHLWPFVLEARRAGAKIVVIDPVRTRTAKAADEWIPIRPGTDGALALAVMHVLVCDDLVDHAYVDAHTLGFDALCERVAEWTPARAAELTGIPAGKIEALARSYAQAKAPAIRINYGMQRHAGGGMAVRTIACLPALVGAWKVRGGGIQLSTSGTFRMNLEPLYRSDLLAGRTPRTINMNRLGDVLSLDPAVRARALYHPRPADPVPTAADAGAPIAALVVYNANPAASNPDQQAVLRGLRRDDLFTVVMEHFQTDTADYADVILPATTQLEHWDLVKSYGHVFLGLNRPAIAPVGESAPNAEIFRRLAAGLGLEHEALRSDDVTILRELLAAQRHPWLSGITWERLLAEGHARLAVPDPFLPFAEGGFFTPSGKCEFYSERMRDDGYDPVPTFTPPQHVLDDTTDDLDPAESNDSNALATDTLVCVSPPAHSYLNSTFANLDRFVRREGEPVAILHPEDAARLGVVDEAMVTVHNDLGAVSLRARVVEDVVPGTVFVPGVWWNKLGFDGRNVNQLTGQTEADMGAGACFYDTRVQVSPALTPGS